MLQNQLEKLTSNLLLHLHLHRSYLQLHVSFTILIVCEDAKKETVIMLFPINLWSDIRDALHVSEDNSRSS